MSERLQNVLAQAGISSRRGAAALIASGVVTVDGLVVREAGFRVDPANAKIAVSGKIIAAPERKRTILLYKPAGVLSSTREPFGQGQRRTSSPFQRRRFDVAPDASALRPRENVSRARRRTLVGG